MNITQTIISTRDFMRHFSKITKGKKEYTIFNHGKPVGVYTPFEIYKKNIRTLKQTEPQKQKKKRVTIEDLEKLTFDSGEANLGEQIDKIVYGIGR